MKKINIVVLFFALAVVLTGCGDKENEKSYSSSDSISITSTNYSSIFSENNNDDKNPGGIGETPRTLLNYNGENFEFDRCIIRVVLDKDDKIIEPQEKDWDSETKATLQAVNDV